MISTMMKPHATKYPELQIIPQADPEPPRSLPQLKTMSYNIHFGVGRDKQYRLDRILDIIKFEKPDIVTLQELDNNLERTNYQNQARIIARELDMPHYVFCPSRQIADGEYGIATFSRLPIVNQKQFDLTFRKRFKGRVSLRTDVNTRHFGQIHIFNVHLGLRTRERRFQRKNYLANTSC